MSNNTDFLASRALTSLLNNATNKSCSEKFSKLSCYVSEFGHTIAYLLMAFALLPQIIRLFNYRHRYIAGISYQWIIIRMLALSILMASHAFKWLSILEFLAFASAIIIFMQIATFSNNLHRQNKIVLIIVGLSVWTIGRTLIYFFVKQEHRMMAIAYALLAMQMLPQILLNSLIRTAKALSKFSIFLLATSDLFLFFSFPTNRTPPIYFISIYYSFSFLLYICFQYLIHNDDHIHIISRSAHTILTPGVDIYSGLNADGKRSSGEDPQMFSVVDLDPMEEDDIIYQAVTTNKSTTEPPAEAKFILYATSGCIFCIETIMTIILIYRVGSPWIIFVPFSIFLILVIFYLLRARLDTLQTETLRKVL